MCMPGLLTKKEKAGKVTGCVCVPVGRRACCNRVLNRVSWDSFRIGWSDRGKSKCKGPETMWLEQSQEERQERARFRRACWLL